MFLWHAISADTLFGGNLREFELEGQHTRQRYSCVHHACHYSALCVLSVRAAAAADGDQESKDATKRFKKLKKCALII